MNLILIILIPLAFIAGGFVAYKGVQLGLRWQVEVKKEQLPTMKPLPNPVATVFEAKQEKQIESIVDEWFHGAKESR